MCSVPAGHSRKRAASLCAGLILTLYGLLCCRPHRILLQPVPADIERIGGHASIRITGENGSARSKFTFFFQSSQQGRIEVSDVLLGRTLYQIIVDRERAVFLIPSKKVYWEGDEEEIIHFFLGFRLSLDEIFNLLSGEWEKRENETELVRSADRWELTRDEKGRILSGMKDNLRFEVKEFVPGSGLPRILFFQHPLNSGRLKILRIEFNRPVQRGDPFSLSFLASYRRVSWEEIEKILADEY